MYIAVRPYANKQVVRPPTVRSISLFSRLIRPSHSIGQMVSMLLPVLLFVMPSSVVQAQQTAEPAGKTTGRPALQSAPGVGGPQQMRSDSKPAPPSLSHPKALVTPITKLYPVSSQQAADSILADSLGHLFEQGDAHFEKGEYNHTINLNNIIVQGDPHNMEAYGNSAYLLWSTVRHDEAITVIKLGIKANPNTYYMYDEMGNLYSLYLKKPASAIPYYEQATKYKDCYFLSWNSLAHCYEKTNQWDKAVSAWETAAQYMNNISAASNFARATAERDKRKNK